MLRDGTLQTLRWDELANVIDVINEKCLGRLIRNNAFCDMIVDCFFQNMSKRRNIIK